MRAQCLHKHVWSVAKTAASLIEWKLLAPHYLELFY